ncbi:MAG: NBR1-Ig-like domain-containing protein [Anaerolineales bacterium]
MRYRFFRVITFLLVASFLVIALGDPSQTVAALTYCDKAQYVADVTIPDGTNFSAGTTFIKTWRLKNVGTCTWTTSYSLVFYSGEKMGGLDSVPLPLYVAPGQTVDVSLTLTAPMAAGSYGGFWMLRNASGSAFGLGLTASNPFWVKINVLKPFVTAYDFTSDPCSATWHYNGGPIPCPVTRDRDKIYGYMERYDNPILEDGTAAGKPGLLYIMEDGYSKYIQGVFPVMDIFPGDHFQATISCEGGAVGCYARYRLEFMNPATKGLTTIWSSIEKYDGRYVDIDVDLRSFAWKKGQLVLSVYSYGPGKGDRALWVAPRVVRQVDVVPIPVTMSPTSTLVPTKTPGPSCTDRARFIADVTIPDWTTLAPNTPFTKVWRLMNVGTCTWTTSYTLVFFSGNQMAAPEINPLPISVAPGGMIDISLNMVAPSTPASYLSSWILKNEKKVNFGVGSSYDTAILAAIKVAGTPLATVTSSPIPALTATPTVMLSTAVPPTLEPPTAIPPTSVPPTSVPSDSGAIECVYQLEVWIYIHETH